MRRLLSVEDDRVAGNCVALRRPRRDGLPVLDGEATDQSHGLSFGAGAAPNRVYATHP